MADPHAAAAAATEQHQVADDRNVVERPKGFAAGRAPRARADQRLAQRQPMNDDVEEAADRQAEKDDDRELDGIGRHRFASSGLGSGNSSDDLATSTRPVSGSISYGVPDRSSGTPLTTPWRISQSQV